MKRNLKKLFETNFDYLEYNKHGNTVVAQWFIIKNN